MRHEWTLSPKEAVVLQKRLARQVLTSGCPDKVRLVAGCDLAFEKKRNRAIAAMVVLTYPELDVVEEVTHIAPVSFPYIPGLLSFREGPAIMELFSRMKNRVDLVMFDGQGLAHPRGLGIASHLGLLLEIPSIGVGKSRLFGHAASDPALEKGAMIDLYSPDGGVVGRVVRTRSRVSPVYVSVGHGLDLDSACKWVLSCTGGYRIPEPTRQAHLLAARTKAEWLAGDRG